jgi:microcystin-dependent protein
VVTLNNITTTAAYSDANEIVLPSAEILTVTVRNAAVFAQFMGAAHDGRITEQPWTQEVLLTPRDEIRRATGFRVRSAVAGSPAQVVAQLLEPGDPMPESSTPSSEYLASSGAVGSVLQLATGDYLHTHRASVDGAVLCDGVHYDSIADPTFQPLYNIIGTTYGGTGPSDFAVPDRRDRVGVGAGGNTAIGANDGIAAGNRHGTRHGHPVTDPGHTHPSPGNGVVSDAATPAQNFTPPGLKAVALAIASAVTGITIGVAADPQGGPAFLGEYVHIVK